MTNEQIVRVKYPDAFCMGEWFHGIYARRIIRTDGTWLSENQGCEDEAWKSAAQRIEEGKGNDG